MKNMNKIFVELAKRWGADLKHRKGETHETLNKFENDNNVFFPDDMKEFYVSINGMTEEEWQLDENAHEVKFLPFRMLKSKSVQFNEDYPTTVKGSKYYSFSGTGDYDCFLSHEFVIRLSPDQNQDNLVYLINENREHDLVAHSFRDFVRKCLYYGLGDPRLTPTQSKKRMHELEKFYSENIGYKKKWWRI